MALMDLLKFYRIVIIIQGCIVITETCLSRVQPRVNVGVSVDLDLIIIYLPRITHIHLTISVIRGRPLIMWGVWCGFSWMKFFFPDTVFFILDTLCSLFFFCMPPNDFFLFAPRWLKIIQEGLLKKIKTTFGGSPWKKMEGLRNKFFRGKPHHAPLRWLMVDPLVGEK